MGILKHVEYKIVCDQCYCDLTDYEYGDSRAEVIKNFGIKKHKGQYLCDVCKNGYEVIHRAIEIGDQVMIINDELTISTVTNIENKFLHGPRLIHLDNGNVHFERQLQIIRKKDL